MAQRPSSKAQQRRVTEACRQILEYLVKNPDAGDTEDGILQWWLMERALIEVRPVVEAALEWLLERDLVFTVGAKDSRMHYRLNHAKGAEIQRFLRGSKSS
jgi:hypothetical protein